MLRSKFLALTLLLLSLPAQANNVCLERQEFSFLKAQGESQNFISQKTYALVEGLDFIALEAAWDEYRTCVFGFSLNEIEPSEVLNAPTRFVCFEKGEYSLHTVQEYCWDDKEGCKTDPGAISIGIGNIKINGPTAERFPFNSPKTIFTKYPERIAVKIIQETRVLGGELGPKKQDIFGL